MLNKKKNNKGFTLVELLVVIAIIGILAVVAVPALLKNINKAKVADVESDYSSIKSAVLSYYADKNEMPTTTTEEIEGSEVTTEWNKKLADYMDSVPTEAKFGGTYTLDLENNTLYLTITDVKATDEQVNKLKDDIGGNKVSDITNKTIKLELIENTDM
ncbi:type II secretion system protein [Romboutsia sp.]|uniref:type II secretion system protein n=1 Tax=Romboutsia sp. TaxID=1965302 RepID=UPI002C3A1501|nr:prepilin-type N-terminal cleavage/methylation domain-containing protein [Romboutsia sp.]HSQ88647.1 prepilin-type N-terminal cleavage/methylation domain-containing protein [Romboutsia sp.]